MHLKRSGRIPKAETAAAKCGLQSMSCGLLAGGIPVPHTDTSCVVGNTNKNKIQCSPTQVPFNSDRREKVKKTDYAQQWPF